MGLNFYNSVAEGFKLKVRKFWVISPTFVEATGEELAGGTILSSPPLSSIGLKTDLYMFDWLKPC